MNWYFKRLKIVIAKWFEITCFAILKLHFVGTFRLNIFLCEEKWFNTDARFS